jgi:ABC-type transport system involved in cytochrome c biogenesis permease subunit
VDGIIVAAVAVAMMMMMMTTTQPREQFEELLGRNSSGSRSRKSKLRSEGLVALTT